MNRRVATPQLPSQLPGPPFIVFARTSCRTQTSGHFITKSLRLYKQQGILLHIDNMISSN